MGSLLILTGCSWVPLSPEAENVRRALSPNDILECEEVGSVNAQTTTKIGFIARGKETISDELTSLARNDAAEMGADTIAPNGPPSIDGRQRFTAYRCN